MENSERLVLLMHGFAGRRVLVLGDAILDRYWWGEASRLSPEAPVPVVRKQRATCRPGGAANAAANLAALGASVELCSVAGADREADELRGAIEESGAGTDALLIDASRPTTTKTRIVAAHQQVARVDDEVTTPVTDATADRAVAVLESRLDRLTALVISDYAKGFLTPRLLQRAIAAARRAGVPVFVDPKGMDATRYAGSTVLKPNRLELGVLAGAPAHGHEQSLTAGRQLSGSMPGTNVIVTEGADGMTRFSGGAVCEHVRSVPHQVFDVTGAGDTVLAVLSLAVSTGATYADAMELAAAAAGVAIGLMGTTAVTAGMLEAAVRGRP
jgi:D-beta-D-heptose 7-phosphate kinase / D-beta-D-heptose 1-phosphate adenosyltransferase